MTNESEQGFAKAMRDVYLRAKTEAGYNATYFLRMLSDHGPIDTARRLIMSNQPSEGFTQLWRRKRLDLTVEAQVLRPEFVDLFTDDERAACRRRLTEYGYDVGQSRDTRVWADGHALELD